MTASRSHSFLFVTGALMMAAAVAQAQQPQQSSNSATAAAAPTAAASQPAQKAADTKAAAAQPAKTASAQKTDDPSPTLIRDAANAGFRLEHIRGNVMFCRTATELGSNFPVRTCYNEEQTKIKIEEYRTERNQLEEMHSNGLKGN
jgi:hypothetical protein